MKPKFLRCTAPGCRTLTGNGFCDLHREADQAVDASPWRTITAEQWEAARVRAEDQFAAIMRPARHRAALHADLADQRHGADRAARRAEQPIFSGELT